MTTESLVKFLVFLFLLATAGLSAYCFANGKEILGAINAALAVVNVITLARY